MGKSRGVVLGENHLRDVERGIDRSRGHGHSGLGLETALAKRGSAIESDITHPYPRESGQRLDSTVPEPRTQHVKSNTTKGPERFHAGHGDTHGGFNETAGRSAPTMEERIDGGRAPTRDSPVPLGSQHPDLAVRSKPEEIAKFDPDMGLGERPRGVLDR